ncbi:motile sperm domain-containing protein 1-like [Centruroides vittatus]|uniref:motile sperm domain-containing protein 1-like n=1 Tax=Centruroides vittatus TaxID=120091 RepID=UPI00350EA361
MQSTSSIDGKLPVFVFPSSLTFYEDDQSSHKQILTLYNPYDFAVKFRVLATSPSKYVVVDPEGVIKARCCVDIVIRHNAIFPSNYGVTDKFRIQMQEYGHSQVAGKRDVLSILCPTKPDSSATLSTDAEQFQQLHPLSSQTSHRRQYSINGGRTSHATGPNFLIIALAIICLIALMLPTTGDDILFHPYLQLSTNQKLIAAYTLGLVTIAIFRT